MFHLHVCIHVCIHLKIKKDLLINIQMCKMQENRHTKHKYLCKCDIMSHCGFRNPIKIQTQLQRPV